ncbi:Protein YcgL [Vibrio cholerae LMA3984-4]|nr:Protein YcgL [Vibrio cholerae LMA3984-4]
MLCSIYKSPKKEGTYLYIPKRDDFSQVPDTLKQMFGKPIFVMLVNLEQRQLAQVNVEKVKQSIRNKVSFCSYRLHQKICWNNIRSAKRAKLPDEDGSRRAS